MQMHWHFHRHVDYNISEVISLDPAQNCLLSFDSSVDSPSLDAANDQISPAGTLLWGNH